MKVFILILILMSLLLGSVLQARAGTEGESAAAQVNSEFGKSLLDMLSGGDLLKVSDGPGGNPDQSCQEVKDLENTNFFLKTVLEQSKQVLRPMVSVCKNFKIAVDDQRDQVSIKRDYNLYQAIRFVKVDIHQAIQLIIDGKVQPDEEVCSAEFCKKWLKQPAFQAELKRSLQVQQKCLKDFIETSGILERYYMPVASTKTGNNVYATLEELLKKKYISIEEALIKFEDGSVRAFKDNQNFDYKSRAKSIDEQFASNFSGNIVHSYVTSFIFSAAPSIAGTGVNPVAAVTVTPGYFYNKDGNKYFYNPARGLTLNANFSPLDERSHNAGATVDNTGLTIFGGVNTPDMAFGGWAFLMPGWYGVGGNFSHNLDEEGKHVAGVGAAAFIERDAVGGALTAGVTTPSFALAAKGIVAVSKDREVQWLAQYPEDGPIKELRGKHQLNVTYKNGYMVRGDLGVSPADAGVPVPIATSVRLKYQKNKELEHTLWVDDSKEAREFKEENQIHAFHRIFEKINVDREFEKLDVMHPLKFAPGERVKMSVSGTLSGAIVLSLAAITGIDVAQLGYAKALHGEFELEVTRLGDRKVLVGISPTKLESSGIFLVVANALGVSYAKELLKSLQYNFVFDFDKEETENYYKDFIETGRIPYLADMTDLSSSNQKSMNEAIRVLGSLRKNKPILDKKGITQTFFSSQISPATRVTGSVMISPWHDLQKGLLKAKPTIVTTNGNEAIEYKTWQMEISNDKIRKGYRKKAIYASVKTVYRQDMKEGIEETISYPDGITLRAEFTENKVRGEEHNAIIDEVNTNFGRVLDSFKTSGHKQDLKITLERTIYPKDIENLLQKNSFGDGSDAIREAATRTGLDEAILTKLVSKLNHQGQDAQAAELMNFIHSLGKDGLKGFAAIHTLLGGKSNDLIIRSRDSEVVDAIRESTEFLHIADPGTSSDTQNSKVNAEVVKGYYKSAKKNIAELVEGIRAVVDNPTLIQVEERNPEYLKEKRDFAAPTLENLVHNLNAVEKRKDVEIEDLSLEWIKKSEKQLATIYSNIADDDIDLLQKVIVLYSKHHEVLTKQSADAKVLGFISYKPKQYKKTQKHYEEIMRKAKKRKTEIQKEQEELNLSEDAKLLAKHAPEVVHRRQKRLDLAMELIDTILELKDLSKEELNTIKEHYGFKSLSEKEISELSGLPLETYTTIENALKKFTK
ncbi:MAG: hypothetical protein HQK50_12035 [Oligoflexia bacterium]|nr:hypothetical protein [Oligoflexia bacterium]